MAKQNYTPERFVCPDCKLPLALSEFYIYKKTNRRHKLCKKCSRALARKKKEIKSIETNILLKNEAVVSLGFVYFILATEMNRVKIGYTLDMKTRLKGLIGQSPSDLAVLHVMKGGKYFEAKLHKRFKAFLHHNEWYEYSRDIKNAIAEYKKMETLP